MKLRRLLANLVLGILFGGVPAEAGGFDLAIESALPRVVKLYGLGVGREAGYGSGVLVSPDGLVLTVFSLLIDAQRIRAVTHDGTTYEADVVYRDSARQLALLQLKGRSIAGAAGTEAVASPAVTFDPFPYFEVPCDTGTGDCPEEAPPCPRLQVGDWVVAAGNPFKVADGAEPVSIAHGVYSARTRLDARRKVKDFPYRGDVLVIDAVTSNPGAPGSALVDLDGNFVGMIGRVVISNRTHTHFNYAIPRDVLIDFMREAAEPVAARPARTARRDAQEQGPVVDVGLRVARAGYRDLPPFVERVRKNSPAEKAGVLKDDLILSINNANVADIREFDERWKTLSPGQPIDLVIRRDRRILNVRLEP